MNYLKYPLMIVILFFPVMDSKQQRKKLRQQRVEDTAHLFEVLFDLSSTYIIKPCVAHCSIQQKKFNAIAEKKNKEWRAYLDNVCALINCPHFLRTTISGVYEVCPKEIKGVSRKILKNYKCAVNWFNQWSAKLRQISELDCASEFEKFIRQNAFPSYDITNGFETAEEAEAQVVKIMNPHPEVVHSRVDDWHINLGATGETYPIGYTILRISRRGIIIATEDFFQAFMGCLKYGIIHSTLVSLDDHTPLGRRFRPKIDNTIGQFCGFSLRLVFNEELTINSSCDEIKRQLISYPESLAEYNLLCKDRIITLITQNSTLGVRVLFCGHDGCSHADGFLFDTDLSVGSRMSRTHAQCPNGHAFCLRCFKPEHDGFCADTETERQELLLLPNQKLCPTCKTVIFKDGGCNHMTCGRCHQNFCWLCNRKFSRSEPYVRHTGCNQFDY